MKAHALDYAARGWRVFPVAADGRSPMLRGGCHAASCDPDAVSRWWSAHPAANIALACGPDSGVLALDVDSKGQVDGFAALAELEREFEPLPETVRSATPSGGAHILFRHPLGVTPANRVGLKRYAPDGSRRVYAGLDVRGAGGSICLPPSQKASGSYAWETTSDLETRVLAPVPRWLLGLMLSEPPPRPAPAPLRVLASTERAVRYVTAAVDGECGQLASMKAGSGRNLKLFQASANLFELVAAGLLPHDAAQAALEAAASHCGLVKEDGLGAVRATIASGMRRGLQNPRELAA